MYAIWQFHFLENPYLRLLSNSTVDSTEGTRPLFTYVIAVDDDGTREEQKNLSSIATFEFNSNTDNSRLAEFVEASFQYYIYALPALGEDAEGTYALILSK